MPGLVPGIHVLCHERKVVDGRDEPGHDAASHFSACSASYSALLQPPLPSLCSGSAAARKAARSGSITVLLSLRNSSASFCSCSRICLVALSAACVSTSSNTFLSASESFGRP